MGYGLWVMNDTLTLTKDCWCYVFSFIDSGSVYKSLYNTSHDFKEFVNLTHPSADIKFANPITTLEKLWCIPQDQKQRSCWRLYDENMAIPLFRILWLIICPGVPTTHKHLQNNIVSMHYLQNEDTIIELLMDVQYHTEEWGLKIVLFLRTYKSLMTTKVLMKLISMYEENFDSEDGESFIRELGYFLADIYSYPEFCTDEVAELIVDVLDDNYEYPPREYHKPYRFFGGNVKELDVNPFIQYNWKDIYNTTSKDQYDNVVCLRFGK